MVKTDLRGLVCLGAEHQEQFDLSQLHEGRKSETSPGTRENSVLGKKSIYY